MDLPEVQGKTSPRAVWAKPAPGGAAARVRLMGDSLAFACPGMENTTVRHSVTVMCAIDDKPLAISCDGGMVEGQVLLIQPMARKTVHAIDVPLFLIDLEPTHPQYRRLIAHNAPDVQALNVSACTGFLDMARAFEAGSLRGRAFDVSARQAIDAIAAQFPARPPLTAFVHKLMLMLDEDPGAELDQLVVQLDVSSHHASRLFFQDLGLPLRRYALSVKIRAASSFMGSGLPLTQVAQAAGFVDSAHFAKVWLQCYGASPSQFFHLGPPHLDTADQPDWLLWYMARRDRSQAVPAPLPDAQTPLIHRRVLPRSHAQVESVTDGATDSAANSAQ